MFASLSQKIGFVFVNQFLHFKALIHYFQPDKIGFRLLIGFKTNLQGSQIQRESFGIVSRCALLSEKNGFVFVNQFWHFKSLSHYFQLYKIRFRLLTGWKTILQETQIQRERFGRVSTFASLSQKNRFVFTEQFSHFKALSRYFQPDKFRFRLLTFNHFIRNSNIGRRFLKSFSSCVAFPESLALFPTLQDFIQVFDRLQNYFIGNSLIGRRFWKSFNVLFAFPEKWFSICQPILAF